MSNQTPLDRRDLLTLGALAASGLLTSTAAAESASSDAAPPSGTEAETAPWPTDSRRRRARELGIRIGTLPTGPWNAITDVPGVHVGHTTVIRGSGPAAVGQGPARTGVTVILPTPTIGDDAVAGGWAMPNGNGELGGLEELDMLGVIAAPIALTGTTHVGVVHQAISDELARRAPTPAQVNPATGRPAKPRLPTPVVGETWDGSLSEVGGRYLTPDDVLAAWRNTKGGPVVEGAVGGGTGMVCYGFKGGIGTASRRFTAAAGAAPGPLDGHTVGVLVQANHGRRPRLRIDGVAVGEALANWEPQPRTPPGGLNSILIVIATDVPLLDHELARVARRAVHGLAATGSISSNSSGDFAVAFSTANRVAWQALLGDGELSWRTVDQDAIEGVLAATAEAVEEAIVNALCMAEDMVGVNDELVPALPLAETVALLRRAGRFDSELQAQAEKATKPEHEPPQVPTATVATPATNQAAVAALVVPTAAGPTQSGGHQSSSFGMVSLLDARQGDPALGGRSAAVVRIVAASGPAANADVDPQRDHHPPGRWFAALVTTWPPRPLLGRAVIDEFGTLSSPVYLVAPDRVGVVYDAALADAFSRDPDLPIDAGWPPLVIGVRPESDDLPIPKRGSGQTSSNPVQFSSQSEVRGDVLVLATDAPLLPRQLRRLARALLKDPGQRQGVVDHGPACVVAIGAGQQLARPADGDGPNPPRLVRFLGERALGTLVMRTCQPPGGRGGAPVPQEP